MIHAIRWLVDVDGGVVQARVNEPPREWCIENESGGVHHAGHDVVRRGVRLLGVGPVARVNHLAFGAHHSLKVLVDIGHRVPTMVDQHFLEDVGDLTDVTVGLSA